MKTTTHDPPEHLAQPLALPPDCRAVPFGPATASVRAAFPQHRRFGERLSTSAAFGPQEENERSPAIFRQALVLQAFGAASARSSGSPS
jgi:hypothetical protein